MARANADPLALAAGEFESAFADLRVVAVLAAQDEVVRLGHAGCFFHVHSGHAVHTVGDIFEDTAGEQLNFLRHHGDLLAKTFLGDLAKIFAVDQNTAALGIIEALQQAHQSAFARSAGSDQGDGRAGRNVQIYVLQGPSILIRCSGRIRF